MRFTIRDLRWLTVEAPEECDALFAANLNRGNLEELLALYESTASRVQQDSPPVRGMAASGRGRGGHV
jgi:hypothetical protein